MSLDYIWSKGYKKFSQNNEDGLINYIFDNINHQSKIVYEICAGDGIENNSALLIHDHDFSAYLFDADNDRVAHGQRYYQHNQKVNFIHAWITRSNIIDLIKTHNYLSPNIDLLSIDMDGVDYWILKEILDSKILSPRVIILEYQDIIGSKLSLTVPYSDNFNGWKYDSFGGPNYSGASLMAFINLLKKDYAFVFCEQQGFNAFFIQRKELEKQKELKELVDINICFNIPKVINGIQTRWPRVNHMKWINV
jgi:hypothetical protein